MEFDEFREQFIRMHPGGAPRAPEGVKAGRWLRLGIAAMFVCSAGISGVHTVPTIYTTIEGAHVAEWVRQIVSAGSFVAVELGILIMGYDRDARTWSNRLMMGLGLAVAITANVVSISRAISTQSLPDLVVALILGVFAPLMALLSGEKFRSQREEVEKENERQREAYKAELVAWDGRIVRGWEKYQSSLSRPSKAIPMEIPLENERRNSIPSESTLGHRKAPDASERVESYLSEHPEALHLDGLELARVVGVGKSTAYAVLKEWKQKAPATNGNGNHE